MAGVHGLQHVKGLIAPDLANDDAVGAHTQRVLDKLALADFAFAFEVWRPCLKPSGMRLLKAQLRCVLDREEPLAIGYLRGHGIQKRGFAATGAARNEDAYPPPDAPPQKRRHLFRKGANRREPVSSGASQIGLVTPIFFCPEY